MQRRRAVLAGALALPAWPAAAASHHVEPGQSLEQALQQAADGDQILLGAGEHRAQVGIVQHKRLTIRGVGATRPVLLAAGAHAEGKAILVVRDGDVLIDNIEFRGARVPDGNGAGIRFEKGRLSVRRCAFIDNQNGILSANFADAELEVQDCEFAQAPAGRSLPHLLYVGRIARFTLSGSRLGGGNQGHLVKSRALLNDVRYNQLVDGAGGRASYELEFPNGGVAHVVGNIIAQSEDTGNPTLLAFGAEGSDGREQALHLVNNTFINPGRLPAVFVRVHLGKLVRPLQQALRNNLFLGPGGVDGSLADRSRGNFMAAPSELQDAEQGQFRLHSASALRGRGVRPGRVRGVDLRPSFEFTPPVGKRAIAAPAAWSPGAYQD